MKKWRRSRTKRMFAGVIGGLSERMEIDAKWLRIIFILLMVVSGFFPLAVFYLLLVFIMPNDEV